MDPRMRKTRWEKWSAREREENLNGGVGVAAVADEDVEQVVAAGRQRVGDGAPAQDAVVGADGGAVAHRFGQSEVQSVALRVRGRHRKLEQLTWYICFVCLFVCLFFQSKSLLMAMSVKERFHVFPSIATTPTIYRNGHLVHILLV